MTTNIDVGGCSFGSSPPPLASQRTTNEERRSFWSNNIDAWFYVCLQRHGLGGVAQKVITKFISLTCSTNWWRRYRAVPCHAAWFAPFYRTGHSWTPQPHRSRSRSQIEARSNRVCCVKSWCAANLLGPQGKRSLHLSLALALVVGKLRLWLYLPMNVCRSFVCSVWREEVGDYTIESRWKGIHKLIWERCARFNVAVWS